MKFVRAIWKLLVGVKDALVLLFMLLFFGMLYVALSVRPEPVSDGVLDLALEGQRGRAAGAPRMGGRRRRQPDQSISPARPRRGARCGQGRRPGEGGRARSRRLHGRRPDRDVRRRRRGEARARLGQAGGRLCDRLYRRPLSARLRRIGNLAEPARGGGGHRTGRLQPLFQGPARQARSDRQRLPRRHLQVGGRAVHPQRHVARGEGECAGARPGGARDLAADA